MCDPITAILGVASIGMSLLAKPKAPPKPPPALPPATPADPARDSSAVVKVGDDQTMDEKDNRLSGARPFVAQRKTGSALGGLGGLGRSSLEL